MKQVAGTLRLALAQYREMAAFAQFASDLDEATQRMLARGARLVEILKQPQYKPMSVDRQVMVIYAATNGWLDNYPLNKLNAWHDGFLAHMDAKHAQVGEDIVSIGKLTDDLKAALNAGLDEYKEIFGASGP
jgi:F-type H+-transporting ATPase subunit alpha